MVAGEGGPRPQVEETFQAMDGEPPGGVSEGRGAQALPGGRDGRHWAWLAASGSERRLATCCDGRRRTRDVAVQVPGVQAGQTRYWRLPWDPAAFCPPGVCNESSLHFLVQETARFVIYL